MYSKSGLRVVLNWKIYRPDSVIAAVIRLWLKMKTLKRDYKRGRASAFLTGFSFTALGGLKFVSWLGGLTEPQVYRQYPIMWYLVVVLGVAFTIGLFYTVKKALDIHPNVQLRSRTDDELRSILNDFEYAPWHSTAKMILEGRSRNRG